MAVAPSRELNNSLCRVLKLKPQRSRETVQRTFISVPSTKYKLEIIKVVSHLKMVNLPLSHSDSLKLLRLPLKERQAIINVHAATARAEATCTFSRSELETLPHHHG